MPLQVLHGLWGPLNFIFLHIPLPPQLQPHWCFSLSGLLHIPYPWQFSIWCSFCLAFFNTRPFMELAAVHLFNPGSNGMSWMNPTLASLTWTNSLGLFYSLICLQHSVYHCCYFIFISSVIERMVSVFTCDFVPWCFAQFCIKWIVNSIGQRSE